jgi:hypothetical protein
MTFFNDRIAIHHIFPEAWCKKKDIPPSVYNSIINKTALSRASNIAIGGDAPSSYLRKIEAKHGMIPEQLDEMLRTHLINPAHLRDDDFDGFFETRMKALAGLVTEAMGKPVVEDKGTNEIETDLRDTDEDLDLDAAVISEAA